jgi:hypothetical protein
MTLRRFLEAELVRLAGLNQTQPTTVSVQDASAGVGLELDILTVETLGCLLQELRFQCQTTRNTPQDLHLWANELSQRITYLLESLGALEFDPQAGQALIRSLRPSSTPQGPNYYEVLLELKANGTLVLKRYLYDKVNNTRQVSPLCLTKEVLGRLADDLVDTAPKP